MFAPVENIMIVGVGGRGIGCLERWIENGLSGVNTMAVNSSEIGLWFSHANIKINIGAKRPVGWCTRGKPELGRLVQKIRSRIMQSTSWAKKVIINVGLGSGTGTGATPVVARLAKEAGGPYGSPSHQAFLF